MAFVELLALSACRVGGGTFVEMEDRELAVFRLSDPPRVIVLDNTCPHAGGNLSAGIVRDGTVECPLHQWPFELATGVCVHSERARVNTYATQIRDGMVWVDLP